MRRAEVDAIASALPFSKNIENLSLPDVLGNNPDSIRALAAVLPSHPTLRVLDLAGNSLTAKHAQWVASALQTNRTLEVLLLNNNHIGDVGATYLATSLGKKNSSRNNSTSALHILRLDSNGIGDAGVIALSLHVIRNNNVPSLAALELHDNLITEAGCFALADDLGKNTSIRFLDLSSNRIASSSAAVLFERTLQLCNSTVAMVHLQNNPGITCEHQLKLVKICYDNQATYSAFELLMTFQQQHQTGKEEDYGEDSAGALPRPPRDLVPSEWSHALDLVSDKPSLLFQVLRSRAPEILASSTIPATIPDSSTTNPRLVATIPRSTATKRKAILHAPPPEHRQQARRRADGS